MSLTEKQRVVLKAIQSFIARRDQSPSVRDLRDEMAKHGLEVSSTRSVVQYLETLEENGFIQWDRNERRRGTITVGGGDSLVSVPIYGAANAGTATLVAEQNIEGYLQLSKSLLRNKNTFAVQVQGDSMNRAVVNNKVIEDGDYILVNYEGTYDSGDIVLAVIDGLATIKRVKKMGDQIGLFPESSNDHHRPIYLSANDDFLINGKVLDVLKG